MNIRKLIIFSVFHLSLLGSFSLQAYDTPFLKAIAENNISTVKTFIKKGEDVNKVTGFAPLHVAAYNARAEIVKLLVESGADVNMDVKNMGTPLQYCSIALGIWFTEERKDEFLWIMQYLIDCGADVNAGQIIRSVDGKITYKRVAALSSAITIPDTSYAELLIDNGADINLGDDAGFYKDSVEKYKALIEKKYSHQEKFESQYKIDDLNTLECDSSSAYCINDIGQIVGSYLIQNRKFFFIRNADGETSLIDLPLTAEPVKLTNRGFIAGNYKSDDGNKRGFFWSYDTGFVELGSLGGATTIVCDINERGQVVGQSETLCTSQIDGNFEKHAFIWQKDSMQDLGTLTGDLGLPGDESIAYCIHNSGTVLGSSNVTLCHKGKIVRGNTQAIIRKTSDTEWQIISDYSHLYSAAYAIGNNNEVVLTKKLSNNQEHVVVLNLDTRKEIGLLNGHSISNAKIMKNGVVCLKTSNSVWAFAPKTSHQEMSYTPTSPTYQLSYNPYWKKINGIKDINILGNYVGQGLNIYGEKQAILLTPIN